LGECKLHFLEWPLFSRVSDRGSIIFFHLYRIYRFLMNSAQGFCAFQKVSILIQKEHRHSLALWHYEIVYLACTISLLPTVLPNLLNSIMMAPQIPQGATKSIKQCNDGVVNSTGCYQIHFDFGHYEFCRTTSVWRYQILHRDTQAQCYSISHRDQIIHRDTQSRRYQFCRPIFGDCATKFEESFVKALQKLATQRATE
jgi:hypothetical protein